MMSCAIKNEINRVNFFCTRLQNHATIVKKVNKNRLFIAFPKLTLYNYYYVLFLFNIYSLKQFLQKCIILKIPTYQVFFILKKKQQPNQVYIKYIDFLLKEKKVYNKKKILHFLEFFCELCRTEGFFKETKCISSLISIVKNMKKVNPKTFEILWVLHMGNYLPFDLSHFMYYEQTILHELLMVFHLLHLSPKPLRIFFDMHLIANALADFGLSLENIEKELYYQYGCSDFLTYFCLKSTGCLTKICENYEEKRRVRVENKINDLLSFSNSYTKIIKDYFYFQKKYWNISVNHLLNIYNVEMEYRENEYANISEQLKIYFMY